MATFEFDPVQRDAVKAYKPSKTSKRATNLLAAIDAQERAKKPATKAKPVAKPTKAGAMWSSKLGAFFPVAWLDVQPAAKAGDAKTVMVGGNPVDADGKPLKINPIREMKGGGEGAVWGHYGGAFGNNQPIELIVNGKSVKGFVAYHANIAMFNPAEEGNVLMLKPGMLYRIPAGMDEI